MPGNEVRILGVDPGTQKFGYALLLTDPTGRTGRFIKYDTIKLRGQHFAERLQHLYRCMVGIYEAWKPDMVGYEAVFRHTGKNNPDANTQLAKGAGVIESTLPGRCWRGYENQPSSARKALGVGQGNYLLMRARLMEDYEELEGRLIADREDGIGAFVGNDAVSGMVQAVAVRRKLQLPSFKGVNLEYEAPLVKPDLTFTV
jgi:crossover junction endodeoxyribonuclease RuvC